MMQEHKHSVPERMAAVEVVEAAVAVCDRDSDCGSGCADAYVAEIGIVNGALRYLSNTHNVQNANQN